MARLLRVPYTLALWIHVVRRRHVRTLFSHPHHYTTAAGLTMLLLLSGHYETGAIVAAWCYALIENISTAADDSREVIERIETEVIDAENNV